jgi:hypothetical protein
MNLSPEIFRIQRNGPCIVVTDTCKLHVWVASCNFAGIVIIFTTLCLLGSLCLIQCVVSEIWRYSVIPMLRISSWIIEIIYCILSVVSRISRNHSWNAEFFCEPASHFFLNAHQRGIVVGQSGGEWAFVSWSRWEVWLMMVSSETCSSTGQEFRKFLVVSRVWLFCCCSSNVWQFWDVGKRSDKMGKWLCPVKLNSLLVAFRCVR